MRSSTAILNSSVQNSNPFTFYTGCVRKPLTSLDNFHETKNKIFGQFDMYLNVGTYSLAFYAWSWKHFLIRYLFIFENRKLSFCLKKIWKCWDLPTINGFSIVFDAPCIILSTLSQCVNTVNRPCMWFLFPKVLHVLIGRFNKDTHWGTIIWL